MWLNKKPAKNQRVFRNVPGTGLEPVRLRTRPSNVLVYQFQHPGIVRRSFSEEEPPSCFCDRKGANKI